MYRKMDPTILRNCTCIQPAFLAYRTQLTGKPSAAFDRAYFVLETKHADFKFTLGLYA
jgi:hypothetical protein